MTHSMSASLCWEAIYFSNPEILILCNSLEMIRLSEFSDKSAVYLDELKYLVPVINGKST